MGLRKPRILAYYSVCVVTIPVYALVIILLSRASFATRYAIALRWIKLQHWALRNLVGLDYEVDGLEHIPDGAAILYCKHQSMIECITTQLFLPPQTWVLKRELLWVPMFGWALARLNPIAIDRRAGRSAVEQITEQGEALFKHGIWVVIFPEGTRMPLAQTRAYGMGGAVLASKTGVPVIPLAHNAGRYWLKGRFDILPGRFRMRVGPPIDTRNLSAEEVNRRAKAWINQAMAEIDGPEEEVARPHRNGPTP